MFSALYIPVIAQLESKKLSVCLSYGEKKLFYCSRLLFAVFAIDAGVARIHRQIRQHHAQIEHVEEQHIPLEVAADELADDAKHIARADQQQKRQTLALGGTDLITFTGQEKPKQTIMIISKISAILDIVRLLFCYFLP